MASIFIRLGLLCGCIVFFVVAKSDGMSEAGIKKRKAKEERFKLLKEYAQFEDDLKDTITSIFKNLHQHDDCPEGDKDANGACQKAPPESLQDFHGTEHVLMERVENVEEILLALISPVTVTRSTSSANAQKSLANVPRPILVAGLNESIHVSCDSKGQRLNLCIWEHHGNGERPVIYVDEDSMRDGGKEVVDGIFYEGAALSTGQCGLRIQNYGGADVGRWSCTLISENGGTFTGAVLVVSSAPENLKQSVYIPQPVVRAALNASVQFSCKSKDQPLTLFVWERRIGGGKVETIVIEPEAAQEGGNVSQRISYFGRGLLEGECGLRIHSLREEQLGTWCCSLLGTRGTVPLLTGRGEVDVLLERSSARIMAATNGGVVKAWSPGEVISITPDYVLGTAIDTMRQKLYWTSWNQIYRSEMDGTTMVETLLDTEEYGYLWGLAFDFIAGNIYVVSHSGYILACQGALNRNFKCVTVLHDDRGDSYGIALDPNNGNMYFGICCGSIQKAGMDGSSESTFVAGVGRVHGLVVDFESSRLYWAEKFAWKIQSCSLADGGKIVDVAAASGQPWGIAVVGQMVYWSLEEEGKVESMGKDGSDVLTVYNGTQDFHHLASPDVVLPVNRTNPCEWQSCVGVCVLSSTSYTCLE